ncbi:AfsR/SARP family transcriptional regulator [Glaciibacter superstes]|uniref:AfsR/SARP family transcriptional regulator n=1 Tax=Glaciibacter superstes TaxID=501023 RepID=UPI0003B2FB07|nr:BTAD domain-containing putative transcriptional regulator [Glaciibacter superstes]
MSSSSTSPRGPEHGDVYVLTFGGLRLAVPEIEISHRPPRELLILARLLVARGKVVSTSMLVDTLWGDAPPASAFNQVQRHIGELRRLFEPRLAARSTGRMVLGVGEGYRLDISLVDSDIERSSRLWAKARASATAEALELYSEALALVAGPVLSGMPWTVLTRPEFEVIERDRVALALDAADCALAAGDSSTVLGAIEAIAAAAPLDERLQARLIRMLGRSERRADAIAVYDKTRQNLMQELEVAPSKALQSALDEVVKGDRADQDSGPNVPRRLPLSPASLVERVGIRSVLEDGTARASNGEPALIVVSGMAGIGKTTLAVEWAHSVADSFPDGQLFVNLGGFDRAGHALTISEALGHLLEDLGVSLAAIRGGEDERRDVYRRAIAGKRIIVVLDNATDAKQVRSLLPGSQGSLVIVTSRGQLTGLIVQDGAVSLSLSRLGAEESRELLTRRLGSARVAANRSAVDSIIASCAGLPLALALAAAASASGSANAMNDVAGGLAATASALDVLSLDATNDLRTTFEWSYRALTEDAAWVFQVASVHPGTQISLRALSSIANLDLGRTSAASAELVVSNMLTLVSKDQFALHDLLRVFASELAERAQVVEAAQIRLVEYYVHSTRRAFLSFGRPSVAELKSSPPITSAIAEFRAPDDAIRWFLTERQALIATFELALALGLDRSAALLALDWQPMRQTVDSAYELVESCELATEAAVRVGEPALEAELRRNMASHWGAAGQVERALGELESVLLSFRERGDEVGEANALRNMSELAHDRAAAVAYSERSVAAARRSGRSEILAVSLISYSDWLRDEASAQQLWDMSVEAEQLVNDSGSEYLRPYLNVNLALAHAFLGHYVEALAQIEAEEGSLDLEIQASHLAVTALALAGLGQPSPARAASNSFDSLVRDYPDFFLKVRDAHALRTHIDAALAASDEVDGSQPTGT